MTDKSNVSAHDANVLLQVILHVKGPIATDWDAVAIALKYKNATVAKTRFGQIKRKLNLDTSKTPVYSPPKIATTTKAKKRKLNEPSTKDMGDLNCGVSSPKEIKHENDLAELPGSPYYDNDEDNGSQEGMP